MAPKFAPKEPVVLDPPQSTVFSRAELSRFDGVQSPQIYVAIKRTVFDVTKNPKSYGPGGSYAIFAGKDASRGLAKSSLKPEDANEVYADLPANELGVLDDWYSYFSQRYNVMGTVDV
ncbi:cytochrome b5-like heme/steroid binding domain-containing protein [Dipodascopsis tothii]|uniref:cytochrome b5-like heme/steroid binding domain-containing protein n=1 Tax=Dipodascopsis tothii TaxID=44089 RepID=UPI0034CD597B